MVLTKAGWYNNSSPPRHGESSRCSAGSSSTGSSSLRSSIPAPADRRDIDIAVDVGIDDEPLKKLVKLSKSSDDDSESSTSLSFVMLTLFLSCGVDVIKLVQPKEIKFSCWLSFSALDYQNEMPSISFSCVIFINWFAKKVILHRRSRSNPWSA